MSIVHHGVFFFFDWLITLFRSDLPTHNRNTHQNASLKDAGNTTQSRHRVHVLIRELFLPAQLNNPHRPTVNHSRLSNNTTPWEQPFWNDSQPFTRKYSLMPFYGFFFKSLLKHLVNIPEIDFFLKREMLIKLNLRHNLKIIGL